MASEHRWIRPPAWWLNISLTIMLVAYCVSQLASIGTTHATLLAMICASFPLLVWWEARRLRNRGDPEAANTLVIVGTCALVAFSGLAMYTAELAASSGCPPQ